MNFARLRELADAQLEAQIEQDIAFVTLMKPEDWESTVRFLRHHRRRFVGARPDGAHIVAVYRHRCSGYYGGTTETMSEFRIRADLVASP